VAGLARAMGLGAAGATSGAISLIRRSYSSAFRTGLVSHSRTPAWRRAAVSTWKDEVSMIILVRRRVGSALIAWASCSPSVRGMYMSRMAMSYGLPWAAGDASG
jgi:hypothetical protein